MRARLTGRVLTFDRRNGISKSGSEYDFTEVQIVSAYGVGTVTLPTNTALELRAAGNFDSVDWAVEFSAFGGNVRCNYVSDFSEDVQAEAFARLGA